ncbi:hypothetical protein STRTUCAR8_05912 [Streptomyces turgidiscabies Car8]|uniref:Uncharacterized protein n=1 Tax=Streptomyces turgidiscabies (strain Car8) TaxID=698760 RepID=L7FDM5_STRT8|nr:hypothetical protein STRTUCAR8_05912 [Streptomyces turgidiscabies Car8]
MISTGNGHANAKPSGVSSARARQLRDFAIRPPQCGQPRQGRVRATRGASLRRQAMGSNDLLPYALTSPLGKLSTVIPGQHPSGPSIGRV